jgi:SAM-dependent methyltransferase
MPFGQEPGLLCKVSEAVCTCHRGFTGTPHSAEGLPMASSLQITGTPAEIYEQHMVPAIFVRWAPDLVEAAGVRPGDRALDVACGTGVVTRLLAERVGPAGTVVGLDINPEMLAVARIAAPQPNIEWVEGSAVRMALPDATFDEVLCEQGLQFVPDKPAALAEMRRVLKPGGRLALSCWCAVEHMLGYLALEQALAKRIGPEQAALPPFSLGDADTLRNLVTGAGFREVRLRIDAKMIRFQSAEHMVRALVGGAPTMLGALAAQGAGVLDTIVAEVSAATRAYVDDEGWAIPAVSHIVTARA